MDFNEIKNVWKNTVKDEKLLNKEELESRLNIRGKSNTALDKIRGSYRFELIVATPMFIGIIIYLFLFLDYSYKIYMIPAAFLFLGWAISFTWRNYCRIRKTVISNDQLKPALVKSISDIERYVNFNMSSLVKFIIIPFSLVFGMLMGLAIGMACCIMILLFVTDELSYDRYHENSNQIYRAGIDGRMGDRDFMTYTTAAPFARTMLEEFPEIINASRFLSGSNKLITYGDKNFIEDGVYYADSTAFDIFSWEMIKGNPKTALANPGSIVFTESMVKKYFGDEDPMDKTVTFDNDNEFKITGVIKDVPHNSHFHFDFLGSLSTFDWSRNENWLSDQYASYLLFDKGSTGADVEAKIRDFVLKYVGPQVEQVLGISIEEWEKSGNRYGYFLEPLTGIYLNSEATFHMEPVGDKRYVIIFSIVAIFILVIACVNFMNLTTAKASNRAREVGIRKVVGARRGQLIFQFLNESFFLSILAMFIALLLVYLLLPGFNNITQKELSVNYLSNSWFIPGIILMTIFVGLFAGSYSSISLSSFSVLTVLKGKIQTGKKSSFFRSGLVVFQFAISIGIIIATIIVYNQLNYMQNKKLGFEKENVIVIERPNALGDQLDSFKEELLGFPDIDAISATSNVPGKDFSGNVYQRENSKSDELIHFQRIRTDYDYTKALGIIIKDGRYFSQDFPGDSNSVVINESAVKSLGYNDPVGKLLIGFGDNEERIQFQIIGIVEDFHTESMHERIPNVALFCPKDYHASYMAVKVNNSDINKTLKSIEKKWQEFLPQQPFDYFFMDDYFNSLHKTESRTGKILGIFALLALFIASLGLFGLSSFISEQRTKEIGIRKVMGSTVSGILVLLSKQFTLWVIIANILAWPVAYYLMDKWLQNFEYKIHINFVLFIIAGLASLFIALLTISYQTLKAASTNPANSLRYE
ncbi:ABC transporter permease [Bacteroidota bacterium]